MEGNQDLRIITKAGTAILRPVQFHRLCEVIAKKDNQVVLKIALFTGMRYIELCRFQQHREWLDGNNIIMPKDTPHKCRTTPERTIKLTSRAMDLLPFFFDLAPLVETSSWCSNMKYWAKQAGFDPAPFNVKVTRKTWESWLFTYYSNSSAAAILILQSQGHNTVTAMKHYVGLSFSQRDKDDMKDYVEGWLV